MVSFDVGGAFVNQCSKASRSIGNSGPHGTVILLNLITGDVFDASGTSANCAGHSIYDLKSLGI